MESAPRLESRHKTLAAAECIARKAGASSRSSTCAAGFRPYTPTTRLAAFFFACLARMRPVAVHRGALAASLRRDSPAAAHGHEFSVVLRKIVARHPGRATCQRLHRAMQSHKVREGIRVKIRRAA